MLAHGSHDLPVARAKNHCLWSIAEFTALTMHTLQTLNSLQTLHNVQPCTRCTKLYKPSQFERGRCQQGPRNPPSLQAQLVTLAEVNTTNLAALLIFEFSEDGHSGIVRGLSLPRIVTFLSNLWGRSDIHGDGGSGGMSTSDSVSPSPT